MIRTSTAQLSDVEIDVITLSNDSCRAVLTNLGARLLELHIPDRHGDTADVVLQRPNFADMRADDTYMGSTAGRFANRIREGRLVIDGRPIRLSLNEGEHHLHGGVRGFDGRIWSTGHGDIDETDDTEHADADIDEVTFWYVSPHGEQGYPGTLTTSVTYRLCGVSLDIEIRASTDAPTVANIVNHSYFNLGGHDSGTVLDHRLRMRSSFYVPVDDNLLPTGEIRSVADTPFDFRTDTPIGARVAQVQQSGAEGSTGSGAGYDHNWVLGGAGMREVVWVSDPASGRHLTLWTDQPGVQFYSGGYLEGVTAKGAGAYPAFAGFTLETQTFPDGPNVSHFPRPDLRPGQPYLNSIRLDFSVRD